MFTRHKRWLTILCVCFSLIIFTHMHFSRTKSTHDIDIKFKCSDTVLVKSAEYRGDFIVFKNFVRAKRQFKCEESITLSVPGDYRFLDNIIPLVDRWRGPLSVALYAPGYDFFSTLKSIAYLRNCASSLIKELVTFHVFFDVNHMPKADNHSLIDIYEDHFDCTQKPPFVSLKDDEMYKQKYNLFFPINVARNVAKINVQTHFVFPSDIELYPSRNFIHNFFNLMSREPHYFRNNTKNVFVMPLFEILEGYDIPETKAELIEMVNNKTALTFHEKICKFCHIIPKLEEWKEQVETKELNIFTSTKRKNKQRIWEPFFVCTQKEPLWDERLNWEGQGNKMCQVYYLCILDYDFLVFDNAFLIHKPGVKKKKVQNIKFKYEKPKNNAILRSIQEELKHVYGTSQGNITGCIIHTNI